MRHARAQFNALLGIGRADDRADGGIPALAARLLPPCLNQIGHRLIQRAPVFKTHVLKLAGGRIARLHQHEHARSVGAAGVGKGLDAVHTEIRVDRRDVRAECGLRAIRHIRLADISVCVTRGRRANVVALHVRHHDKPLFMRIADRLFVDFHACRAIHLIIRHLHLDRRHNVVQRVNQAHVVGVNSFRRILEGMNAVWQNFPDKVFRQIFNAGIEARDSRVFKFRNSLCEFFHDIHKRLPFLGFCPPSP